MNDQALVQKQSAEITTADINQASQGIAPMVQMVATGQISIEQLDRLMGLQERHEAAEAVRQYNTSMAAFRAEVPAALRDGKGQNNKYATFGSVMNAINAPLGNNGFNVDFQHNQDVDKGVLTVVCTVTHSGGHSKSADLTVKVEKLGSANTVQSLGGNVSYLKRYCVSSLTGLATEDDDGRSAIPKEPVAPAKYDTKRFNDNWPLWVGLVEREEKKAASIFKQVSDNFELSEDQIQALMSLSDHEPKEAEIVEESEAS